MQRALYDMNRYMSTCNEPYMILKEQYMKWIGIF